MNQENQAKFEEAQARLLKKLETCDLASDEYATVLKDLKVLTETYQQEKSGKSTVSADAILGAVVTVATMLLVLNFEKIDVVRTKAFGLVPRPK